MKLNTIRLQEKLLKNEMQQYVLAEKCGVTEVSMSRYVNGQRMPKGDILVKMADALGTTPAYLTGMDEFESPGQAYAEVSSRIETKGKEWSMETKKRLIREILDTM